MHLSLFPRFRGVGALVVFLLCAGSALLLRAVPSVAQVDCTAQPKKKDCEPFFPDCAWQQGQCVPTGPPPDPCEGVTCPPADPDQCQSGTGTCNNGACEYASVPNGQPCDDGNSFTDNDMCTDGICSGTMPPPPTNGCICNQCSSGLNVGLSCSDDGDCGGTCSSNTQGGAGPGGECRNDSDCPPNSGKKSNRGTCEPVQGRCIPTACPKPPTTMSPDVTYQPGDFSENVRVADKYGSQVQLSNGMYGRAIAYTGERIDLSDCSAQSSITFHDQPDAAAIFPDGSGGFYYASNAEVLGTSGGGAATIHFDSEGEPINYFRILDNTNYNCGGGRTPWGSWVSCEENSSSGRVWQSDPSGAIPARITDVVERGGNYESFAYDDRAAVPNFFTTEDSSSGPVVKYTPGSQGLACYNSATDAEKWCTLEGNDGTHEYLYLTPNIGEGVEGILEWRSTQQDANPSWYPYCEGIDRVDSKLYITSKTTQKLFILDLDNDTYKWFSTSSGAFNNQPDQIKLLTNDPNEIVYFCEDGGSDCGVHGRDTTAQFFSIIDGPGYSTETTGLAFSPDASLMFVSFQGPGVIWQFWRTDGHPFTGNILDIKYHGA